MDTTESTHLTALIAGGGTTARKALQAACRRCGMLPVLAASGHDAVERFKKKRHPIVIVGMDLEDVPGFILIKRIKRLAWFTDFIFFAPRLDTALAVEAIRSFASDLIPFSATPKELDDALLRAANRVDIYRRIQEHDLNFRGQVEKQLKLISHDNKNYIHSASQSLEILASELERGELKRIDPTMRQSILAHLEVAMEALQMSFERNLRVLDEGLREDVHGAIDAFRDFDLAALARKCCTEMRTVANTRAISLKLLLPTEKTTFFGLERGMYHVLANLIHNAIKYSPTGGEVRIHLKSGGNDEDGVRMLMLRVSDDGPGFPENQDKDAAIPSAPPSPESGDADESPPEGTGFGLSFIQDIVDRHVGHMKKGSSSSGGAAVSIYLPVLE